MIIVDLNKCDFCGTCVAICPEDAIELEEHNWILNEEKCVNCRLCVEICPIEALR